MRFLILGYPLRLDTDHHAHALHRGFLQLIVYRSARCSFPR
jgi:hypothetical protein